MCKNHGQHLTGMQAGIILLVARGLCDKEIAHRLNTTVPIIKLALRVLYRKFDVGSRAQLLIRLHNGRISGATDSRRAA